MNDAKFNTTPLASRSSPSSTIHLWPWLFLGLPCQSRDD